MRIFLEGDFAINFIASSSIDELTFTLLVGASTAIKMRSVAPTSDANVFQVCETCIEVKFLHCRVSPAGLIIIGTKVWTYMFQAPTIPPPTGHRFAQATPRGGIALARFAQAPYPWERLRMSTRSYKRRTKQ